MNKRGVFFSTDALIALIIILLTAAVAYPIIRYSDYETLIQSDIMNVLSTLKIGEINNDYVKGLIADGKITDLNKSVLEQIGEFYISNTALAKELGDSVLSGLDVKENIGLWFNDELISSVNSSSYDISKNVEVDRQIISGIQKGKASEGFVAKAWLKKINEKDTSLFVKGDLVCGGWKSYSWGYYCGSATNTIDYEIDIPSDAIVRNATWLVEGAWVNQNNILYVNGNQIFNGVINYYRNFDITSIINPGKNIARLNSPSGGDDGASHVIVEYTTPEMQTFTHQTIFPFNIVTTKSDLHYEKSIFIPSQITDMNISLNSSMNTTIYLRKGEQTILIGSKNPVNNRVNFSNTEIHDALASQGLSYSNLNDEYFFIILDIGKNSPGQTVTLGANSNIYVESSDIKMPYGTIDITQKIPVFSATNNLQSTFYRNLVWKFSLPINSIPIFSDWQFGWLSTSSGTTNQEARANSIILYNSPPDIYLSAFSRMGYTPSKASGVFKEGINNFTLDFGPNYGVSDDVSYGFLTYFIKSYVNYGDTKEKASGGIRTVQFEDGSTKQFIIGNSSDSWDPDKDALDDAVDRLIQQLDTDGDGKVDLILNQENFDISILDISGVPYIWSTEVQVRRWH